MKTNWFPGSHCRYLLLSTLLLLLAGAVRGNGETNLLVRIMAANLTSGTTQSYEPPGIRIIQGLKPDIVAIQEFRYNASASDSNLRALVDLACGPDFFFYCEPYTGSGDIPNGIISRWPILTNGSWADPVLSNRGFAWALIDLPGSNDLYVVSVHLSTSSSANRNTEATEIKANITAHFPPAAWIVVAGDLNTDTRSEAAVATLKTFLSDSPIPVDQSANPNTSANRSKPYDYVLPSFTLATNLAPVIIGANSHPNGLVFDSRVFTPLSSVSPVLASDSGAASMQHMAVIKDFLIAGTLTNPPSSAPVFTLHPKDQTVPPGADATFTTTVSGAEPLAYQWWFNGSEIAGATATVYTRTSAQPAHAGPYWVVVTNRAGAATSSVATLAVRAIPPPGSVIAQWNLNNTNSTLSAPAPSAGSGIASLIGGTTAAWVSGSGSTDPAATNQAWNTTTYPLQGTANQTAGARFQVSTAGWRNLVVRWDQRASNTGSKYSRLQYTTNGLAWSDYPTPIALNSAGVFESKTNHLGDFPGVNDNPHFAFRLVAEFESTAVGGTPAYVGAGGTYGPAGTVRFDMVTVLGDPITTPPPAPATLSLPTLSGNLLAFTVTGTPGAAYILLSSPAISPAAWTPAFTNFAPFRFETPTPSAATFYRAVAQ